MSASRMTKVFVFDPVGFDRFSPHAGTPAVGTRVVKTQPVGCPKNGSMGHCYVQDAETGSFYGLVMTASLTPTKDTAALRDLAAEARDLRSVRPVA